MLARKKTESPSGWFRSVPTQPIELVIRKLKQLDVMEEHPELKE